MPRRNRTDYPGAWHHVMNRGIAKRPLFENRVCMRQFLAYLALAVRRGEIQVHVFCLLPTHFHLLVRSPKGQLATAMQRILSSYCRWFNRRYRRDGTLYRARYMAKLVESMTYRRILVSYIDSNPSGAGIVDDPADYPYGSAQCWATGRFPPWLSVDWILEELGVPQTTACGEGLALNTQSARYGETFGATGNGHVREIVERRTSGSEYAEDALDDLVGGAPDKVRAWMIRKARLADGTVPGQPLIGASLVAGVLEGARVQQPDWPVRIGQRCVDAWLLIEVMMLRDLCSLSFPEIGRRLRLADATPRRHYLRHRQLFERDACYRSAAQLVVGDALRRCHQGGRVAGM